MRFELIDRVIEHTDTRIVATKAVSRAEEYLADHFPSFPVLPGVFMLEALVHAARELLARNTTDARAEAEARRLVLGEVRALKYGTFVAPGDTMRIDVTLASKPTPRNGNADPAPAHVFRGEARVVRPTPNERDNADRPAPPPICVAGRFTLRPINVPTPRALTPPQPTA